MADFHNTLSLLSSNHSPLTSITLISLSLFSLLVLILFLRRNNHNHDHNLPPSPPGWPLIGNLHQLGGVFHRSLGSLSAVHGPVMLVHMGQAPTLVVSSAEAVKEIVKNNDVEVSDRPTTTAVRAVSYGNRNLAFAPYGEHWRMARKMTVHELLSSKRVQDFEFVRVEETARLVERIRRACDGESVNVTELVLDTVNSVVSRCIVGHTFGGDGRKNAAVEVVLKVMKISTAVVFVGDFVPSLSWIDHLRGVSGRLRSTFREVDSFLEKVIQDREAVLAKHDDDSNGFNSETCYMVDLLLKLQKDESCEFKFTRDNIKAFLLDMLTAGTNTTSIAIEWLMAELMRNPKARKKAQEEIRRIVGKKSRIDTDDIDQMSYLKCVIKESLRLHPPAPLLVPRQTTKEIRVGGYRVPANTRLLFNAWAIQRDKASWDDPDEFIPERFDNSAVDLKSNQDFKFVAFGFGRRGCAGVNFAISELEYLAANLLYWFDWQLPCAEEELDMSEADGFAVFKKYPLQVIPMVHKF